jgi:hypothetical protein
MSYNRFLGAWLKRLFSRRIGRPAGVRFRLRCEELEARRLLTVYQVGVADPNATWHSIEEVNHFAAASGFVAGDQILFQSGQTFAGNLYLESTDQQRNMGRPDAPITIGSYDPNDPANLLPAPATIAAGAGNGIKVFNAAGFRITDLNIVGGWNPETAPAGNAGDGIFFDGNLGTGVVLPFVHIDHVTVSGFGADYDYVQKNDGSGILFGDSSDNPACAYQDVAITDCLAYEDNLNGIFLRAGRITNAFVDHDVVHDIYGLKNLNLGYGIHLRNLDTAVVQRCEVYNTGLWGGDPIDGGPVGIDVYYSSYVLVQFNDSHDNQDHGGGGDGDGFQLGEHDSYCIMQYNYSHDNYAVGYLFGSSARDGLNAHNVLRYNVSENDCRYSDNGAILLEKPYITDIDIYNNTIYLSPNMGGAGWHGDDGFSALRIPSTAQDVRVYNNVFETTGGIPAVSVTSNDGPGVLFQGNDYYADGWVPGSSQPLISWGGAAFVSLDQWRLATGYRQEYAGRTAVGSQGASLELNPGTARQIDDPANPNYVVNHIDQLGGLLAAFYGSSSPLPGVDQTQLVTGQWDPFGAVSRGGYLAMYWAPPEDFSGQTFSWGGDSDPHTVGAFQFPVGT